MLFKSRQVVNFQPNQVEYLNRVVSDFNIEGDSIADTILKMTSAIEDKVVKVPVKEIVKDTEELVNLTKKIDDYEAKIKAYETKIFNLEDEIVGAKNENSWEKLFHPVEIKMLNKCSDKMRVKPLDVLRTLFLRQALEGPGDHLPYVFSSSDYKKHIANNNG